jgi:hypothetical protein
MWFLERIITPSITACPPKASDGSFGSLVVKLISEGDFTDSYMLLRKMFEIKKPFMPEVPRAYCGIADGRKMG